MPPTPPSFCIHTNVRTQVQLAAGKPDQCNFASAGPANLPIEVAKDSGNEQVYGQLHDSSDSDESSGPDDHSDSGDQSNSGSSHLEVEVLFMTSF